LPQSAPVALPDVAHRPIGGNRARVVQAKSVRPLDKAAGMDTQQLADFLRRLEASGLGCILSSCLRSLAPGAKRINAQKSN
jgi:hypothetical protein